jgi:hypothetical protein
LPPDLRRETDRAQRVAVRGAAALLAQHLPDLVGDLGVGERKKLRSARLRAGESRIRQRSKGETPVAHHVARQHTAVNTTHPLG